VKLKNQLDHLDQLDQLTALHIFYNRLFSKREKCLYIEDKNVRGQKFKKNDRLILN